MFLGYVGAIAGGIGLAACLLTLSKIFRFNLPRWVYPAAAGLGMILLTVHIEYSWFDQTTSVLPAEVEVVETFSESTALAPWTFLVPRINRFIAVDHSSALTNPAVGDVVLLDTFLLERLSPTLVAEMYINCATGQRTRTGEDFELDANGLPPADRWMDVGLDNPVVAAVCARQGLLPTDG